MKDKSRKAVNQADGMHHLFSESARREMAEMTEAIVRANKNFDSILQTNQSVAVKSGFVAEEYYSETFNLDAIYKGEKARSLTDRHEEWATLEWNGAKLKKNDIPDIVVHKDGKVVHTAQAKYCDTAESTAREMSQCGENGIKYEKIDTLLGPKDQINPSLKNVPGESSPVSTTTVREHAEAKTSALTAKGSDKTRTEAYRQTAQKCTDRLSAGKVSSKALSKPEAEKIASGDNSQLKHIEDEYLLKSTSKQMGNAALGAATISAITSGISNTISYVRMAANGKLSPKEATLKIIAETVASAADSAIKASANVGVQSLMIRYGSREAAKQVLVKQGIGAMLRTNAVTVGVVCAIDAVKDMVRLGTGDITEQEFYERQSKGILTTGAGVTGGSFGAVAGTTIAGSLALGAGASVALQMIGGLSGGIIAGLAMSIAIENGIEKPFRDIVRNCGIFKDTLSTLEKTSRHMIDGQTLFAKFLEADIQMEKDLRLQLQNVEEAQKYALEAINRI